MLKKSLVVMLILMLVFAVGCQSNNKISPAPTPNTQGVSKNVPPPSQIDVIESNAEDVLDDIDRRDWSKAQTRTNTIKSNVSELNPIIKAALVPTNLVDVINQATSNLEKAVLDKKVYESKVQANQISKYIYDISESFKTTLPTDIGRLDYLGREIILNSEVDNWNEAKKNVEDTQRIWGNLKTKMNSTYKKDIDKFDSSVSNLVKSVDSKEKKLTKKNANILLDDVDVLEKDFRNQSNT